MARTYIAIDLKSFYASVECQERGLDPLVAKLVVADASRTSKTICLAVSPSLKAYGIPGRARLFEVEKKVKEIKSITGEKIDFIIATPRMQLYMDYSARIYSIYLKYIAPEDIHVYSIDEVFMDVTAYLHTYNMTAHELAIKIIHEVLKETGITATAGIGSNLYLCKVAMDIVAKHIPADKDGVRIAELDEKSYRQKLWNHRPLTDFWRVGKGYARKLESHGMYTMGDVARCAIKDEDLLYKLFGVNAELLIDHAFGIEPVTIKDIKAYRPENNSISSGQVLHCPYDFKGGKLIVREMTDLLVLDLVDKKLVTDQIVITIGYDVSNLTDPDIRKKYKGSVTTDYLGRMIPCHAHGSANLDEFTSSTNIIMDAVMALYDSCVNKDLLVRRINVTANHLMDEKEIEKESLYEQLDLFTNYNELEKQREEDKKKRDRERRAQEAVLAIKKKYGKNAILKGMNLEEGAQTIARNSQIGGHKA